MGNRGMSHRTLRCKARRISIPIGVSNHELIPSHRKLLWPNTMVVSVVETPGR